MACPICSKCLPVAVLDGPHNAHVLAYAARQLHLDLSVTTTQARELMAAQVVAMSDLRLAPACHRGAGVRVFLR